MALMTLQLLPYGITLGINSALSTLVSQAFGSKQYELCGVYLNRCRFILTIIFMILILPLQSSRIFFEYLGLDPDSAQFAQTYINMTLPAYYMFGLADANKRVLNCMGFQNGPLIIQIIAVFLHFCFIFITNATGWGIYGPALSLCLTNMCSIALLTFYTSRQTS